MSERIAASSNADEQSVLVLRTLRRAQIHLWEIELFDVVFPGSFIARARHDADDGERRRVLFFRGLIVVDLLANRIFSRKKFADETVVHDDRARDSGETIARLSRHVARCTYPADRMRDRAGSTFPSRGNNPVRRC